MGHKTEVKPVELGSNHLGDCPAHETFFKCSGQFWEDLLGNGGGDTNKRNFRDVSVVKLQESCSGGRKHEHNFCF